MPHCCYFLWFTHLLGVVASPVRAYSPEKPDTIWSSSPAKTCSSEKPTKSDRQLLRGSAHRSWRLKPSSQLLMKLLQLFFPVKSCRSSDRSVFQSHFDDLFILQIAQILADRHMGEIRQTGDVVHCEIAFLLVDASHDHA